MSNYTCDYVEKNKYLQVLSRSFKTKLEASTEIINLEAIQNLPKGTELFLSDLHGEDEAFMHILKSGSGIIRKKIDDVLGVTITNNEKNKLAILIYYPREVLTKVKEHKDDVNELEDWYEVTLHRLVMVCKEVSSKYTRSKVRKAMPEDFRYIIEELLHNQLIDVDKSNYYHQIIKTIINIDVAEEFIVAICEVMQRLSTDHLHVIGDIYDRGKYPDKIMDKLISHYAVDIQWGNHDIIWMGAASGSLLCIMNVIRISARYGNLDLLEDGYGISMLPLATYAMHHFDEVEEVFNPKKGCQDEEEYEICAKIHKAVTFLMLKLEDQLIDRSPQYQMDSRRLLRRIDYDQNTITINRKKYSIDCSKFDTINQNNPSHITEEENLLLMKLKKNFLHNERLHKHIAFLFAKGSIYKIHNGNLLYHGCIPFDHNRGYESVKIDDQVYQGKALLDIYEKKAREAYSARDDEHNEKLLDFFWYLWCGANSSLFGKDEMKTFERYFIADKETHVEHKNPYYSFIDDKEVCGKILLDFGLDPKRSKIINGHVPVKVVKGENPVKAEGRLIVIDGGMSKPYQRITGIAGYTLIYNSHGMLLAAHEPFTSAKDSVENDIDMISSLKVVEQAPKRILVADTDIGKSLQIEIDDLKELLEAYKSGQIKS